jgi:hypothetical protein
LSIYAGDAFKESQDLQEQVESYRERYGCYPEVVLADGIYGTRTNRKFLQGEGIRFGGRPLGRPAKATDENAENLRLAKQQRKQDELERIPIEGKFGQGKNGYRLNCMRAKTAKTSEAACYFFVMNLMVLLRLRCA